MGLGGGVKAHADSAGEIFFKCSAFSLKFPGFSAKIQHRRFGKLFASASVESAYADGNAMEVNEYIFKKILRGAFEGVQDGFQ